MITLIVAVTRDLAIGRNGDMIAHLSADLRRFKQLTMGHTLIMGRKTFQSLPGGALPGRRNIVVTRNADFHAPGIETAPSLQAALQMAGDADVMVIGGGEIYAQAMPLAQRLEVTMIDTTAPDADTHFPAINADDWQLTAQSEPQTDPRTTLTFTYLTYRRR